MTVRLAIHDLVIGYGGRAIAGPWTASWEGGGVHVLLGHNGSGKSTLARTLLGLVPPVSGTVQADGIEGSTWVPQLLSIADDAPLRVREVVEMGVWARGADGRRRIGGKPGGWSRSQRLAKVRESLERVELDHRIDEPFANLSGGQKRRALVARALIGGARCVILDEPVAGVDQEARDRIGRLLGALAADEDRIYMVITHDHSWLDTPSSVSRISNRQLVAESAS